MRSPTTLIVVTALACAGSASRADPTPAGPAPDKAPEALAGSDAAAIGALRADVEMICGALKLTGGTDFMSVGPYIAEHMKTDLLRDLFANIRTTTTLEMIVARVRSAMTRTNVTTCETLDTLTEYRAARAADKGSTTAQLAKLLPRVLAAIAKQDVAALDAVTVWPLHDAQLWFDAPACQQRFGGVQSVPRVRAKKLLKCLGGLGRPTAQDAETGLAVYEPGVAVVLRTVDGKLTGLTGLAELLHVDSPPGTPLVRPNVFAAHLDGGSFEVAPDAATREAIAKQPHARATLRFQACADPQGGVQLKVLDPPRGYPGYVASLVAAAKRWKVKPFVVGGRAISACTYAQVSYPSVPVVPAPP